MASKTKDAAVKAENEDKAAKSAEPKRKRTVLSPAEKIAKAEAELAALKEKASGRAVAKLEKLNTQLDELNARKAKLDARIDEVQAEIDEAEKLANSTEDDES